MQTLPIQPGGSQLIGACAALLAIETIFFVLRTTSRFMSPAPTGLDDILIVITFPVLIALNAVLIAMVVNAGAGWHVPELIQTFGIEPLGLFLKLQVTVAELYLVAIALPKLAILSLYLRVFVQKPLRIVCRVLQVVLVAFPLAWMIAFFLICTPAWAAWAVEPPAGAKCGNIGAMEKYVSVPNIITDVIMVLLPMRVIWGLQLSVKERVGVIVILSAGGMGLVVSCLRFAYFFRSDLALTDITDVATTIGKFTTLETAGYFVAACVPVLKPVVDFISKIRPITSIRSLRSILSKRSITGDSESLESGTQLTDRETSRDGKVEYAVGSQGIRETVRKGSPNASTADNDDDPSSGFGFNDTTVHALSTYNSSQQGLPQKGGIGVVHDYTVTHTQR